MNSATRSRSPRLHAALVVLSVACSSGGDPPSGPAAPDAGAPEADVDVFEVCPIASSRARFLLQTDDDGTLLLGSYHDRPSSELAVVERASDCVIMRGHLGDCDCDFEIAECDAERNCVPRPTAMSG